MKGMLERGRLDDQPEDINISWEASNDQIHAKPTGRKAAGRSRSTHKRLRVAVVATVFLCALGFLLYEFIGSALNYYLTVPEALSQQHSLGSSAFRLEGRVKPGSVQKTQSGVDFAITGGGHSVNVLAVEQPPQLFQVGIRVVLVGHFQSNYFWTNRIMIQHSSTYTPVKQASSSRA